MITWYQVSMSLWNRCAGAGCLSPTRDFNRRFREQKVVSPREFRAAMHWEREQETRPLPEARRFG